jgi:hypothetical protein
MLSIIEVHSLGARVCQDGCELMSNLIGTVLGLRAKYREDAHRLTERIQRQMDPPGIPDTGPP